MGEGGGQLRLSITTAISNQPLGDHFSDRKEEGKGVSPVPVNVLANRRVTVRKVKRRHARRIPPTRVVPRPVSHPPPRRSIDISPMDDIIFASSRRVRPTNLFAVFSTNFYCLLHFANKERDRTVFLGYLSRLTSPVGPR